MKRDERKDEELFLLLDSENRPLAHGRLLGRPEEGRIEMRLTEEGRDLSGHELLRLVGEGRGRPVVECRLIRQSGERLSLERLALLDPELREELRVPMNAESFVYPISGEWRGRKPIRVVDLSFHGVAFYGGEGLAVGEEVEMVLPVGKMPLLLHCRILRAQPMSRERALYAAKFVDLCVDEENLISEALFGIEVRQSPCLREEKTMEGRE